MSKIINLCIQLLMGGYNQDMKNKKTFTLTNENCKAIAQYLAVNAVRRSESQKLEMLHEGILPKSKAGDYSDVQVVTPYGSIPWNQVSRINGREIRDLMLGVEKDLETSLRALVIADDDQIPVLLKYIKKYFRSYDRSDWQASISKNDK